MTTQSPKSAARQPKSRAVAKAERRLQLIEATIDCIARHGLSGTTIARVSELAGNSIGLANFHFESKDKLLAETLRHLADEERTLWQARTQDPALSDADRLTAIVESRFAARVCSRRKLAIWFAFYGDAGARAIYRRVLGDVDEERLQATVAILSALVRPMGPAAPDPLRTALALEAFHDGLWLNMLLYPDEFRRLDCRDKALGYLSALLPGVLPLRPPQTATPEDPDAP